MKETVNFDKSYIIGFSSLPFKNQQQFVKEQIHKKLFEQYLKGIKALSPKSDCEFPQTLYRPEFYYLWGKYDVCAVSEVDDLEFATRFFRSYNPIGLRTKDGMNDSEKDTTESEMVNFNYKVVTGINPSEFTSSKPTKPLPYIAISQLKINSAFLIGNGRLIIEEIKCYVVDVVKRQCKSAMVEVKICESFSYHELIVILTSDSLKTLWNIVGEIRGVRFNTLLGKMSGGEEAAKIILDNSLIHNLTAEESKKYMPSRIANHIFESTLSTFGIHFNLFDGESKVTDEVIPPLGEESITFLSRWNIKPGHIQETVDILKTLDPTLEKDIHIVTGKGDMVIKRTVDIATESRFLDFPECYFKSDMRAEIMQQGKDQSLCDAVIDTFTSISIEGAVNENIDTEISEDENRTHRHFNIHSNLRWLTIQPDEIHSLSERMKALWVPKVLSEKVMKLVSTYNNAVMNPDMYLFYVELYPYIKTNFLNTVEAFYEGKRHADFRAQSLYETLEQNCQNIESGFQNRFYQSYWTSEVPEINTDYSGGVHNLISAYDSCYKVLNNPFTRFESDTSFIYVKSDSKVNSSFDAVKMNYLHLIQPLIFCSVATHECCNYALEKWYLSNFQDKILKNAEYEKIGNRVISQFARAGIPFDTQVVSSGYQKDIIADKNKLFHPLSSTQRWLQYLGAKLKSNIHEYVNPELFHYHIIGRINYQYAFKGKLNLFTQTYFNYFYQAGHIYLKPGVIDPEDFLALLIRMLLIRFSTGETKADISEKEFRKLLPKEKGVEKFVDMYAKDLHTVITSLFSGDSPFKSWFEEWESILECDKIIPPLQENKELAEAVKDYLVFESEHDLNSLYQCVDEAIDQNTCDSIYLTTISTYLELNADLAIMERDYETGNPIYGESQTGLIFIDPCGGTFTIGAENRRRYLMQRTKLLRFLYHISLSYKKKYISEILAINRAKER